MENTISLNKDLLRLRKLSKNEAEMSNFYRKLCLKYHPDKYHNDTAFIEIDLLYKKLLNKITNKNKSDHNQIFTDFGLNIKNDYRLGFYLCLNKFFIKGHYNKLSKCNRTSDLLNMRYWANKYSSLSLQLVKVLNNLSKSSSYSNQINDIFKYFFIYQATRRDMSKILCLEKASKLLDNNVIIKWLKVELSYDSLKNKVFE